MMHIHETPSDNWHPLPLPESEQDLTAVLVQAGIPTDEWGQNSAKTVGHLLREMQHGESLMRINPDTADVRREVNVAWIDVLHLAADGTVSVLKESRQEYADGRVRRRSLSSSLGEKMQPQEDPGIAAVRALQEELGVAEPETLYFLSQDTATKTADSYPGLYSQYNAFYFVATLGKTAFNPSGYVEVQADKTNYYEWEHLQG